MDFHISERVEAGWIGDGEADSARQPPRGRVMRVTISPAGKPWYLIRWDNGYEAEFPRSELRSCRYEPRRFKVPAAVQPGKELSSSSLI
jgi:hypothetical protein